MIITSAHVRFWMEKHRPAFGKDVRGPRFTLSTIHECVNDHDPIVMTERPDRALQNLLGLLKLARRNGEKMPEYLEHLYFSAHTEKDRRTWVLRFIRAISRARTRERQRELARLL